MRDALVSLLEVLAVLAFAVGVAGALWGVIGWPALCMGGLIVGAFAWWSGRPPAVEQPAAEER